MERMNAIFTTGCLILVVGMALFLAAILVPLRSWIEPSLYVCGAGVGVMALAPCVAMLMWVIGLCRR